MCRKLDARVAEVVMGFKKICMTLGDEGYGCTFDNGAAPIKYYSTDMNAAMEVVNHMANFEVAINECIYSKRWWVTFEGKVDNSSSWEEKGDADHKVLPTAICLAALAALEAKGDGKWVDNYLNKETEDV